VLFQDGLEAIGKRSFERSSVIELTLPGSVRVIGRCAFESCEKLLRLTCGSGLQIIETKAFARCGSLVSLESPEGLLTIGAHAFWECSRLSNAAFPASLDVVGTGAFCATGLGSVALPPAMSGLGTQAFANCPHLTAIILGDIELWSWEQGSRSVSPFAQRLNWEQPARRIVWLRLIGDSWRKLRHDLLADFLSPKATVVSARFAGRRLCGITLAAE
jgi:hypothetical protein